MLHAGEADGCKRHWHGDRLADHAAGQRAVRHVDGYALAQVDALEVGFIGAVGALAPGAGIGVVVEHLRHAPLGKYAQVLDAGDDRFGHGAVLPCVRLGRAAEGVHAPGFSSRACRHDQEGSEASGRPGAGCEECWRGSKSQWKSRLLGGFQEPSRTCLAVGGMPAVPAARERNCSDRSTSRSATRWITNPSRSIRPCTSKNWADITTRRFLAKTLGHTTTLTIPVSSSSVRKITPLAVPGRWRTSTRPATAARRPANRSSQCSALVRMPRAASCRRKKAMGCAFSDRLMAA